MARPADPSALTDEQWRDHLFIRGNPRGLHLRALAPHARLRALLQRGPRHRHGQVLVDLQGGPAAPDGPNPGMRKDDQLPPQRKGGGRRHGRRRPAAARASENGWRIAGKGRTDPTRPVRFTLRRQDLSSARPATRSPRRCSPTASTSSAARSSTTGRAASCRPAARSRTRSSAVDRGAGRFEPNTRATVRSRSSRAVARRARTAGRRSSCDVGAVNDMPLMLFSAGFYYKTFMWPTSFWNKLYEPIIRARRRSRRRARASPTPTTTPAASPIATCWSSAPVPAGLAAALAAAAAGAKRDPGRRAGGGRRLRCSPSPASRSTGGRPATGSQGRSRRSRPCRTSRVLTRTTAFGYYHQNFVGLCQRLTDHLRRRAGGRLPRERLWKVRAKRVVLATGRHREAAGVRRQRPARRHAGGGGAHLPQPLRRRASASAPSS